MMFDAQESWNMDEPEKVLALVKEVKVWRLSNAAGCICGGFEIRNVHVDICCGKGRDRAVYVWSHSLDYPEEDAEKMLGPIGKEVAQQVEASDLRGPIPIRLHEWRKDIDQ